MEADTASMVQQALSANGRFDDAFNNTVIRVIWVDMADFETSEYGRAFAVNLRDTFTQPL